MSDCQNVEMREALPDLLHDRLDAAAAARVRAHVAACTECAAELELLQRVQRAYASVPAVDTAAIVRALPARRRASVARARTTYSLGVLRLAAAVVFVVGGALVLRTVIAGSPQGSDTTGQLTLQAGDSAPAIVPETASTRSPESAAPRVLAMSISEVDDLEADELETLLGALDEIDAAPVAEPDTLIGSVRGVGS
jgi:anti-sigma factor RsiW